MTVEGTVETVMFNKPLCDYLSFVILLEVPIRVHLGHKGMGIITKHPKILYCLDDTLLTVRARKCYKKNNPDTIARHDGYCCGQQICD